MSPPLSRGDTEVLTSQNPIDSLQFGSLVLQLPLSLKSFNGVINCEHIHCNNFFLTLLAHYFKIGKFIISTITITIMTMMLMKMMMMMTIP